MKKTVVLSVAAMLSCTLSLAAQVQYHPHGSSFGRVLSATDRQVIGKASVAPAMAADDANILVSEDFSKCVKGSEQSPDSEGVVGEIDKSLTAVPGWIGATFRQAGGCAYLDTYTTEYEGNPLDVYLIDTPVLGLSAGEDIVEVRFRARTTKSGGDSFYIVNADASNNKTLSSETLSISSEWKEYTTYITSCNIYSFLEFQGGSAPYYIDDIVVSRVEKLATPKLLPATEISSEGFTANWMSVDKATGYILNPKTIHISDGLTPRYLLNADFETLKDGTIDDPVLPQYTVYSLDDIVPQSGWLARLPYFAKGCLGLSNELMNSYGNSLLQSPTLNLSGCDGVVNVKMRYLAKDVDMFQVNMYQVYVNGSVSLRATKMVYTDEVYDTWKDVEFTIGGGTVSSMIVILLPETTKGTVFFDSLSFDQMLPEGTRYTEPMASVVCESTSSRVLTPGAKESDSFAYSVTAYRTLAPGNNIYSDASNEIIVGNSSDEQPEKLDAPVVESTVVDGGRITAAWKAVEGANAYRVDVYRRHVSNGLESVDIINENFDGIIVGTTDLDHPRAMTLDGYDRLDDYTKVPGWEVFQGYYVDGAVGILGYWNMLGVGCYMRSPIFDLSANGGNMTMNVTVGSDYYNQGATIYLAHENPETGAIVYDDIFPMDEMQKGFHNFTTQFKNGREDSFFVFFPYGYGLSYFDNIRVSQQLPEGEHDYKVTSRTTSGLTATLQIPDVNPQDIYYYTVTALWIDSNDLEKVVSPASAMTPVEGLQSTAVFSGKVVDMDGNAVDGATVSLTSSDGSKRVYTTSTNRWGLFRIDNIMLSDASYTPSAKAKGYLSAIASGVKLNGTNIADAEFKLRKASSDTETEIGMPTGFSPFGAAYLQYNNSESETVYPADAIDLPVGAKIKSIAFDGYCDNAKDVNYRMEIYLENTDDLIDTEKFAPRSLDEMTRFSSGTRTIEVKGSKEVPEELVRFTNDEGFEYKGGNLRVRMSSRSNKSNYVYFLVDGSRTNHSMYRNWSSTATDEWKANADGMPVMRVDYDAAQVGVDNVTSETVSGIVAEGLKGAIRFTADSAQVVHVYGIDGVCVAALTVDSGVSTFDGFAPGLYIAEGQKILVK